MPFLTPPNRAARELITTVIWNNDLVSNLIFLYSGLPSARVYNNANISVNTATLTPLTFNSERWDNDNIHDLVVNTGRLICKTAGKYLIGGHIKFATCATNNNELRMGIRLNGTTILGQQTDATKSAFNVFLSIAVPWDLVVGDYVELFVYHADGAPLNVLASGNDSPEFWMHRVG